ncbi:MAG TPA: NUDIX domain-containing protein [Mycobacteriales bacterium]
MTDPAPPDLSPAPPRPWRAVARLLLVDGSGRLLLLRARDPGDPARGQWWEVPGGGIEPGEDSVAAAVRELAEETGYVLERDQVGPVCWICDVRFAWGGIDRWASMVMHLAQVRMAGPTRPPAFTEEERGSFLGSSWVSPDELVGTSTFPPGLYEDLPRLLAGEAVQAGFRVWA